MNLQDILKQEQPHAKRIAEVRKFAVQMVTGKGQGEHILRYRRRESDNQKEQRENLYNSPTKALLGRLRNYIKKIPRVKGVNILLGDNPPPKTTAIVSDYRGKTLIEYVAERLEQANTTDPNSYTVYSRADKRDFAGNVASTELKAINVPSANVVHVVAEDGEVREFAHKIMRKVEAELVADYYTYEMSGAECVVNEYRNAKGTPQPAGSEAVTIDSAEGGYYKTEFKTGAKEIPVLCNGVYADDETEGESMVTWFHNAEEALKDLMRNKNFLDVMLILHTFSRRWEYVKPCTNVEKQMQCKRGQLGGIEGEEHRCGKCGGTGLSPLFTTDQEVVRMAMPELTTQFLDLQKLTHTEQLDISFAKFLDELVERTESNVVSAIYATGIVERATGAATATQTNYQYEDIYDKLYPYVKGIERHVELAIRVHANYVGETLENVAVRFPNDYKMRPLSDLLSDYNTARQSGIGNDALYVLLEQIISKLNEDNEVEKARIMNRFEWQPFNGLSAEETAQALAERAEEDADKILFQNFAAIFRILDNKFEGKFHNLIPVLQQKEIDAALAAKAEGIKFASKADGGTGGGILTPFG